MLILGDVEFQEFEIPENLPIGGQQAGKLHKLPGGARVFDAHGPDDDDISWSGRFRGASALDRATALDSMRRAGDELQLSVLGLSYTVVIAKFSADIRRGGFEIPYNISVHVITDNTHGIDSDVFLTLDSVLGDDIAAGLSAVSGISSAVTSAMTSFRTAVAAVSSIQRASSAVIAPIHTKAYAATGAIQSAFAALDASVVSQPLGASPLDTGAGGLLAARDTLSSLSALLGGAAYAGRAARNVANLVR